MLDGIAGSLVLERPSRTPSIVWCARRLGHEDLGAAAPDHHEAIELVVGLELPDVGDQLLGEVLLVLALLDVRAVEPLHVVPIEHGRPRLDLLELGPHLLEQRRLEHAGGAWPPRSSCPRRCPSRRTRGRSASASGTTSLIFGERPSVRLPRRIVPICVSEPIGLARPLRMASTPAMVVVLTAPRPTSRTPSLPRAGAISTGVDMNCRSYRFQLSAVSCQRSARGSRRTPPRAAKRASLKPKLES